MTPFGFVAECKRLEQSRKAFKHQIGVKACATLAFLVYICHKKRCAPMWKQWPRNAQPGLFELRANNLDLKPKWQQLRQVLPLRSTLAYSDETWCGAPGQSASWYWPCLYQLICVDVCVHRHVLDRERACECVLWSYSELKEACSCV